MRVREPTNVGSLIKFLTLVRFLIRELSLTGTYGCRRSVP